MRSSYSGNTLAFQAKARSSILLLRSTYKYSMLIKNFKHLIRGQNSTAFQANTLLIMFLTFTSGYFVSLDLNLVGLTLVMYSLTIGFGVSVTYHRYLTHQSFKMNTVLANIGKFFGAMSGTGSPIMWVLTHKMHHSNSDKDLDPHPPKKILYTIFGRYTKVNTHGMSRLIKDPMNKFLHQYYFAVLAIYGCLWALLGVDFFYYGFVFPIFIAVVASNLLNLLGHTVAIFGYRSYNTSDKSSNNPLMGVLGFGEGWHNNHHRYPGSARFGIKWYEVDIGFMFIKACEKARLVSNIKTAI